MLAPTLTFKLGERSLGKALKALPHHSLFSRLREWFESERCLGMRFSPRFLDALSLWNYPTVGELVSGMFG